MSYLQHRRHDSSQDIDGISFSDLRSTNTSYKPVTGYEELDLGDERSSLRPIIDRKPVQSSSPTFAPLNPVNHGILNSAAPRQLPKSSFSEQVFVCCWALFRSRSMCFVDLHGITMIALWSRRIRVAV